MEKKKPFKLVGVAQGILLEDYMECYESLRDMGYNVIAVGGLLKKNENTARYVRVRDQSFMYNVLEVIRDRYPDDPIFALGCFHLKRRRKFEEFQIFGSDYKGWIFRYNSRKELIDKLNNELQIIEKEFNSQRLIKLTKYRNFVKTKLRKLEEKKKQAIQSDNANSNLREVREKIKEYEKKRENTDKELLVLRKRFLIRKGIPKIYKSKIKILEKLIKTDAQELRFSQVRDYLRNEVYAALDE